VFFPIGTIFGERLAYLPSAGFALVLATAILGRATAPAALSRRRVALFFAVALAFAARTIVRNPVWKDDETLFTETARTSPESAKAHYNLAWVAAEKGRLSLALDEYTRATRIYPGFFDAWAGKGVVEQRLGNLAEAEKAFLQSLAVAPTYENGCFRLGYVRELRGDLAGAERAYADGLAKNPKSTALAFRLAIVRSRLRRRTAEADWQHAITLGNGGPTFRLGYAQWLLDGGRVGKARREAREALRRRPLDVTALRLLADTSRRRGERFAEGLAVEKIFRRTRSPDDFDRLLSIAAEDPSYRSRFAASEQSLRALRSEPAGSPGGGAFSVQPARPPADAGGGRSGARRQRRGRTPGR
jgi:tetratricopeptide (TPR) repeat protein